VQADLGNTEAIPAVVDAAVAEFGAIDILVNNAGIIRRSEAIDFSEADWDAVMNVNLKSAFFLTQAVGRRMLAAAAARSSTSPPCCRFKAASGWPVIPRARAAFAGLTRLLANEWAGKGVNVNAIAPGYFATNNTQALRSDESRNRDILARIPAGRWGSQQELGGAAVFPRSPGLRLCARRDHPGRRGWLAR
jgi:2-deoxy-D-gluconate 3-dehydrogenase